MLVNYRIGFGLAGFALWFGSLFLSFDQQSPGYVYFAVGWLELIELNFGWFANIFIVWNVARLTLGLEAIRVLSALGLLCGIDQFFLHNISIDADFVPRWHVGAYLWLASALTLFIASIFDPSPT